MDKPSPFFFFKIYIPHQKHVNFSFHPESHYFFVQSLAFKKSIIEAWLFFRK